MILPGRLHGQSQIPIDTWRLHLSYNNIGVIEVSPRNIFAASESGVLVYDREDQSVKTYNKLSGLSSSGITCLAYDKSNGQLLVGYDGGELDIIDVSTVSNFHRLRDAEVTTVRRINHISIRENVAYLSTAYGVVLFDLVTREIRETWRDLGPAGEGLPVYGTAFLHDSIYLATAEGVLAGYPGDNLLDFDKWQRSTDKGLSGAARSVITFNDRVYAAGPTGVYSDVDGSWLKEEFLDTLAVQSLTASEEHLLMIADSTLWLLNISGQLSKFSDTILQVPLVARQDDAGAFWIGDHRAGLLSNIGGTFSSILPNGPSATAVHKMIYHEGKLFVIAGARSSAGEPVALSEQVSIFENGAWHDVRYPLPNITDISFSGTDTYISSFGSGLLISNASGNTIYDESNSPLKNSTGDGAYISALSPRDGGLWIANYGGSEPLHFLNKDGTWESYSFRFFNEQNPSDISVDGRGNIWIPLAPATGGGLLAFELAQNRPHYKSNVAGSGALPNKNVNCITTDLDGYSWIGTDAGVAYFLSPGEDAIKPIYDNRFLLRDEKITAIEIDPGNRKWIGTGNGVWLFDADVQMMLHNFTTDNSPLLSDLIYDIEIDPSSGEVFIATDKGIVSYRGDATTAERTFDNAKIFPNPVSPGFGGTVSISGLTEQASVRITDISGKLVWRTEANGGTATWNVRDHRGRRASTGVYLVFAISEDGTESMVGKIAVIE
jgi:hypothetical protein